MLIVEMFLLFFGAVLLLLLSGLYSEDKVEVEILYEPMSSDIFKFLDTQMCPNYKDLQQYMKLKFVPFGNATSVENGASFKCHHGPKECEANKLTLCALNATQEQNDQLDFVKCLVDGFNSRQRPDVTDAAKMCAEQTGLNWQNILQCNSKREGTVLLLQAEQETKKYKVTNFPTFIYNRKFKQANQATSMNNFRAMVCKYVKEMHPDAAC